MYTFSQLPSLLTLENICKGKANDIMFSSCTVQESEIFVTFFQIIQCPAMVQA